MAKFGEKLLEFKNTSSFKRIPVTSIKNQWYITISKNSVIKVQDSKPSHTWQLLQGHIHYFTTPVAYFKGNLYSVMDESVLLKWSDEDKNLENAEKVQFQEEVHSILHLQEREPLIVFQSGKFLIIEANSLCHLEPSEPVKLNDEDCLEWVDAAISAVNIEVFYLVVNKKKQRTLYYFSVNNEEKIISPPCTFPIFHEEGSFKACCLNHQDLSFFSLWSDGKLQCYSAKDSSDKVILRLEDICVDTMIDIYCIDSKHIVTARRKTKNEECILEIWDTKQAKLRGSRKVKAFDLVPLQISATTDFIFLNLVSDKLIAIPYYVDSTFASTLNTSDPKQFQQLLWNTDLEVKEILTENESMDVSSSEQSSLDSVELLAARLLNQDSSDIKFMSESEIIKILKSLIRCKKNSNQNDFNKDMYNLLNIIFSASFNDALLIKRLKLLNVEDILIALDILLKYMKHSVNMPVDVLEKPSDLQIVNWICLVISSHTETLLFTKDKTAKKLLKDLKKTLSIKMKEFEDLEGLQSYLSVLQKKDILPQEGSFEKYCLETLDI